MSDMSWRLIVPASPDLSHKEKSLTMPVPYSER
jgi:hypothetical protein